LENIYTIIGNDLETSELRIFVMFCIKSKEHFYYTAKIVFFCLSAISLIVILTGNSRCYSRFNRQFW